MMYFIRKRMILPLPVRQTRHRWFMLMTIYINNPLLKHYSMDWETILLSHCRFGSLSVRQWYCSWDWGKILAVWNHRRQHFRWPALQQQDFLRKSIEWGSRGSRQSLLWKYSLWGYFPGSEEPNGKGNCLFRLCKQGWNDPGTWSHHHFTAE